MYHTKAKLRFVAIITAILSTFSSTNVLAATRDYYFFYDPSGNRCDDGGYASKPKGDEITWIGDSYSVGALDIIKQKFPGVDYGKDSSYIKSGKFVASSVSDNPSGLSILKQIISESAMRPYLVFALGANGGWTEDSANEFLNLLNKTNTKAILVTSRIPSNNYAESNRIIRNLSKYSNIYIADWTDVYQAEFFESDPEAIHPTANGGYYDWVDVIYDALPGGGPSSVSTAYNTNYAGEQVWAKPELQMIEQNESFYKASAQKYGFPWQILAVVHSLESGLSRVNPGNGQGLYQLYSYTNGGTNGNSFAYTGTPVSDAEFARQTDLAAETIASYDLNLSNDGDIKKLFFKYNGTSDRYIKKALEMGFTKEEANNGDGSYYVMNRYDALRDPTSPAMSKYWPGLYTRDKYYDENAIGYSFGAFTKFAALGGLNDGLCGSHSGDITNTALLLSWPDHNIHDKNNPKPEYINAMQSVGNYVVPCNSSGCAPKGASCDIFVSTVMRYSGADENFPQYGPARQRQYMLDHPELYAEVDHNNDVSRLQSGDIFVTDGHIFLYVEMEDGTPGQASASFNGRTGEHYGIIYFEDSSGHYRVFRRINQ